MKITSTFLILWIIQSQMNGLIASGWLRNKRKSNDFVATEQALTRTAYSGPSTRYPGMPRSDLMSPSSEYDSVTFQPNRELIATIEKIDADKVNNDYSATPQYEVIESERVEVMEGTLEKKSQSNAGSTGSDNKGRSYNPSESDLSSSYPLYTTPGPGRDSLNTQNEALDLRGYTSPPQKNAYGSIGGQPKSPDITTIREDIEYDRRSSPYIQGDTTAAELGALGRIIQTRPPEVEVTKPTTGSKIVTNEIMTNKYGSRPTETVKRSKAFKPQTRYMMKMTEAFQSINASDSGSQLPSTASLSRTSPSRSSPSRTSPPTKSPSSTKQKPTTESIEKVTNSKIYVTLSTKYKTANKKGSPPLTSSMTSPYNAKSSDDSKGSTFSSLSSSRKPSTESTKEVKRSMIYQTFSTQFTTTKGRSFPLMMTSKYGYESSEPTERVKTFKPQINYMIKMTEPSQYINISDNVRTASPIASPTLSLSTPTTSAPSAPSAPSKPSKTSLPSPHSTSSPLSPFSTSSLPSKPQSISPPSSSSPPSPLSKSSQPFKPSPTSPTSPPSKPSKISPQSPPPPPSPQSPPSSLSKSSQPYKPPPTSPPSPPSSPSPPSPPSPSSPPSLPSPPSSSPQSPPPPSPQSPPSSLSSASSPPSPTTSQEHKWSTESIKKIGISKTYSDLTSKSVVTKYRSLPTLTSVKTSAHNNRPYDHSKASTIQPSKKANSSKIFHTFSTEYRGKRRESFRPLTSARKSTLDNERFTNTNGSNVPPSHKPTMTPSKTTDISKIYPELTKTKESFRSLTSFTKSPIDNGKYEGLFDQAKTNSVDSIRKTIVEAIRSKDSLLSKHSTKVNHIPKNPASSSWRRRKNDDKETPLAMAHGTNNNNNLETKGSRRDKLFENNLSDLPEKYDSREVPYVTKGPSTQPYTRSSPTRREHRVNGKATEITLLIRGKFFDIRTTTLRSTTASKESPIFRSEVKWKRRDIYNIKEVFDQVCSLEVDEGGGSEALSSWYYNVRSSTCEWFSYRGKRGNGNRFTYRANCENVCVEKQQDICSRLDIVNCGERWLKCTMQPDQRCHDEADRIGAYKLLFCPPEQPICTNRNQRFRKPPIYLTHRKMIPSECMMKKDSGSCYRSSNSVLAFHYDHQYNDCYGFLYSRCGGNSNRFPNKSECMNHCAY